MNAPTIQQVKAAEPETLWAFLSALPFTMEAQILYALFLAGIFGSLASWLVKWAKQQADCLWAYLFSSNVRYTILSGASYAGICITAISSGIFVTDLGHFVGWANVLWFGVTNAFGVDMVANKGAPLTGRRSADGPPPQG